MNCTPLRRWAHRDGSQIVLLADSRLVRRNGKHGPYRLVRPRCSFGAAWDYALAEDGFRVRCHRDPSEPPIRVAQDATPPCRHPGESLVQRTDAEHLARIAAETARVQAEEAAQQEATYRARWPDPAARLAKVDKELLACRRLAERLEVERGQLVTWMGATNGNGHAKEDSL